jgi:hypothetical protein
MESLLDSALIAAAQVSAPPSGSAQDNDRLPTLKIGLVHDRISLGVFGNCSTVCVSSRCCLWCWCLRRARGGRVVSFLVGRAPGQPRGGQQAESGEYGQDQQSGAHG